VRHIPVGWRPVPKTLRRTDAAEITKLLHDAISEARDLARGLGPLGLEAGRLDAALATLAFSLQNQFGVTCTIECPGAKGRLKGIKKLLLAI